MTQIYWIFNCIEKVPGEGMPELVWKSPEDRILLTACQTTKLMRGKVERSIGMRTERLSSIFRCGISQWMSFCHLWMIQSPQLLHYSFEKLPCLFLTLSA